MKISIILPVYNKIKYLETVLIQIRNQSFSDYECIMIDDGSEDGSGLICDKFVELDSRFCVFHTANCGVSCARNLGLSKAKGEYITFIDADDQIHTDFLFNLYRCANESKALMVIGNLQKIWANRTKATALSVPYQGLYSMQSLLPDFAKVQRDTGIYGFCVAKLLSRQLFDGLFFDPDIKLAEDLSLYLDIYPKLSSIYFDKAPYYSYLQKADNSSMSDDASNDYYTQLKIQHKIMKYLEGQQAFCGSNRVILTERLYDYVYFCLFYGKINDLKNICKKIRALGLPHRQHNASDKAFKKVLLFCYEHSWDRAIITLVKCYRAIRNLIRSQKHGRC